MKRKKTVVFGIDGCPEEFLKKWVLEENRLPNFRRVFDNGLITTMHSTIPYLTVPAWVCLLSGKKPGKLETFSFFTRRENTYTTGPVIMNWEKWNPLWRILDANKCRSIFINVPTTFHPEKEFNGIFVSGPVMNTNPENIAYPPELNTKLLQDGYMVDYNFNLSEKPLKYMKRVMEYTEKKISFAKSMYEKEEWDVFMFVFYYIDRLLHYFWKYFDKSHPFYESKPEYENIIYDFFKMIDDNLGYYLDNLPENGNLFIVSDHGMGPNKYYVDLNYWLLKNNYMFLLDDSVKRINLSAFQSTSFYRNLRSIYLRFQGITLIKNLRNRFWDAIPKDVRSWKSVDWSKTKAYSIGKNAVFLNLKGREPEGIINEGKEYEKVVDEIIHNLYELKDPDDNEQVIEKIWKGRDLYGDIRNNDMPDLVIEYRDGGFYTSIAKEAAPGLELFNYVPSNSAYHTINTIFGAYGPEINFNAVTDKINIYDVTPTLLHYMNVPVPDDIDGKVILDIFKEETESRKRAIKYFNVGKKSSGKKALSEEEEKTIMENLKNLGYL